MIARLNLKERLRFARALRSRPYAMVWIGQSISGLGDGVFYIALAWQVVLMTHSGTAMGIVLLMSSIPRLAFMLFGGVAADRLPRRMIILWSDGGRGVVVLLISVLGFLHILQFWHLVIESLVFGVVDGFFTPAVMAITPDLVEKDDLISANALNSISNNVTQLIGPMLGAALIALITPMGAFALNGLSFLLSVGFLASVQIPESHVKRSGKSGDEHALLTSQESALGEGERVEMLGMVNALTTSVTSEDELEAAQGAAHVSAVNVATEREPEAPIEESSLVANMTVGGSQTEEQNEERPRGMRGVIADVRDGFFYIKSSRWLWVSLLCFSIGNLGIVAPLDVAMPKLIAVTYGQGAWLLGLIGAVGPIGSLLALVLVGQAKRLKRRGLLSYLSLMPGGIGIILFGLPWSHEMFFIVGPFASALFGFSIAFFNTTWFTILQEMIPGDMLGRVVSLDMLGSFGLVPIAQGLGGFLTDLWGPPVIFLVGGTMTLCVNALPMLVRAVREMQ